MVQQLVQDEVAPMVWFNKCNPDDANFPDVHKRLASLQAQVEPKLLLISRMQHQIASMQEALQHGEQELSALRVTNYEEVTHLQHCLSNASNEVAALKGQLQEMVQNHSLQHAQLRVKHDELSVAYADLVKEAEQLKEKQQSKVEAYEQLRRDYDKLQADHGRIEQLLSSQQPKQPERPEQPQQPDPPTLGDWQEQEEVNIALILSSNEATLAEDEFEDLAKAMAESLSGFVAR